MPRKRDRELLRAVGRRVGQARRDRGYTQEALSEVIGIEPVTLSRLETGDRALSLSTLGAISQALGLPLGDLLDGTRELPEPPEATPELVELARLFSQVSPQRQGLLLALARELTKGK